MGFQVTIGPTVEPVSLDEAKGWLKVDRDAENDLILSLISSARHHAERYLNMGLMTQTIQETFDDFPNATGVNPNADLKLSMSPLKEVDAITYIPTESTTPLTLESANYAVVANSMPPRISLPQGMNWPSASSTSGAITVTYKVGVDSASEIDSDIKLAMRLMLADWHKNREDSRRTMPTAAEKVLDLIKVY